MAPGIVVALAPLTDLEGRPGPGILFLMAVAVAALAGGLWAGLLAALLSVVGYVYFYLAPFDSFGVDESGDAIIAGVIFVFCAIVLAQIVEAQRALRARAEQAAEELTLSELRYRSLVEATSQIHWRADPEGRREPSPGWLRFTGTSAAGMGWLDAVHADDRDRVSKLWAEAVKSRSPYEAEYRLRAADGSYRHVVSSAVPVYRADGSLLEWTGSVTDVTDQALAEAELRARARQQEAVADLGRLALSGAPASELLDAATGALVDTLGVRCAEVLERVARDTELLVSAGTGWKEGVVGRTVVRADPGALHGAVLARDEPFILEDIGSEHELDVPWHLTQHGIASTVAVGIVGADGAYGVLAAHSATPRAFSTADANFLRALANVLGTAIQRRRAEAATREARDEFETLIEASPMPIVAYDREGIVTLWNTAATTIFGWTAEEAIGRTLPFVPDDMLDEFHAVRRRVLEGHAFEAFETRRQRKDGTSIDVSFWNAPFRDAAGRIRGVIALVADVTERKRREEGLAFVAEVSQVLSATLDYERMLPEVAGLAVPRLADCCIIDVLEEDEPGLRQLAVVHVDPEKEALVRELEGRYTSDPADPRSFVGSILRHGRARLQSTLDEAFFQQVARDDDHVQTLRRLGFVSAMFVPMVVRGRTLGAITLFAGESGRHYTPADLALATEVAQHAGAAIDVTRLYRQRSFIASTLQRSLLPAALPRIPGVELAARYHAAGEAVEVGGDFYDVFEVGEDEWALVIGDVCGKGPEAAAVTGLTRHTIRASAIRDGSPTRTLEALNEIILAEYGGATFCTVALGRLRPGDRARATIACGGHPLPIVLRAGGTTSTLGCFGTLVGIFPDPAFSDVAVELGRGDTLIFYTDGLIEGARGRAEDGEHRLVELVAACAGAGADEIAAAIDQSVGEFERPVRDDVAFLVVRISP